MTTYLLSSFVSLQLCLRLTIAAVQASESVRSRDPFLLTSVTGELRSVQAFHVNRETSRSSVRHSKIYSRGCLSFLWRNFMHPLSSTPRVRITAGFSTPGGYQCDAEPTWLQQPPPVTMLQSTQLLPLPMVLSSRLAPHIQRRLCAHAFTAPKPCADRRERLLFVP